MSLIIKSEVVDIRSKTYISEDSQLFVDTNIWYWLSYSRYRELDLSEQPKSYQTKVYPEYVINIISYKANIYWSGLSFVELAHNIEKAELGIYNKSNGINISLKDFRYDDERRQKVVNEIQEAWKTVKQFGDGIDITINNDVLDQASSYLESTMLDGYDLFMINILKENKIINILTDDKDFTTVADIVVFTANPSIINTAKEQGKLLKFK